MLRPAPGLHKPLFTDLGLSLFSSSSPPPSSLLTVLNSAFDLLVGLFPKQGSLPSYAEVLPCMCALLMLSSGSKSDKLSVAFRGLDTDGDDRISIGDLQRFFASFLAFIASLSKRYRVCVCVSCPLLLWFANLCVCVRASRTRPAPLSSPSSPPVSSK